MNTFVMFDFNYDFFFRFSFLNHMHKSDLLLDPAHLSILTVVSFDFQVKI